ncbi:putative ubiquitin-like-specific protease 2B [Dendrobium catenatum]|uniref:Putative ubiquitin-like-specific protease 2B n=1 Tax=Dendrobium catenatum TaxID=906689 RepID=A0A2I0WPK2_9ASPA|nr:putative ubiquitin-like-specific protease 2B [Dendrobium catenatum]
MFSYRYLQNKVQPIEKKRFHFFNSFFFRKLADLDKDPGSISEGRAAFQRVYVFLFLVRVYVGNDSLHWSLLVICHPGEIITFRDDDLKSSPKVPCILHMDSIIGSHSGLKDLIQRLLALCPPSCPRDNASIPPPARRPRPLALACPRDNASSLPPALACPRALSPSQLPAQARTPVSLVSATSRRVLTSASLVGSGQPGNSPGVIRVRISNPFTYPGRVYPLPILEIVKPKSTSNRIEHSNMELG